MSIKEEYFHLSETVVQVIDNFTAALRADGGIESGSIDRLDTLLRKGVIPKPDEINEVLFGPSTDGET